MKLAIPVVGLCLVSFSVAVAQPVPPSRIRGTIEAFDGRTLTLKAAAGRMQLSVTEKTGLPALRTMAA
ncbi:MAG TPA: hypothetical protein VH702_13570 [Vicinamibacterales bacterium]|jgi:hypothetical protein